MCFVCVLLMITAVAIWAQVDKAPTGVKKSTSNMSSHRKPAHTYEEVDADDGDTSSIAGSKVTILLFGPVV